MILMIRHGERADWCRELKIKYPISEDPPLTPEGFKQARATGLFIKDYIHKTFPDEPEI